MSLADLNYEIPLIGFSGDSNTPIPPPGWETAKIIAKENGPKLAQFIYDLENKCPQTDVRLIAHSMGARVVLSSLDSLTNNPNWNNNNYTIASVHLMGAAVDDEEVSNNINDILIDPTNDIRIKLPMEMQ
jgi:esterase/lipase superfamily enzyme